MYPERLSAVWHSRLGGLLLLRHFGDETASRRLTRGAGQHPGGGGRGRRLGERLLHLLDLNVLLHGVERVAGGVAAVMVIIVVVVLILRADHGASGSSRLLLGLQKALKKDDIYPIYSFVSFQAFLGPPIPAFFVSAAGQAVQIFLDMKTNQIVSGVLKK